ncbi:hypothetical protein NDU88_005627 [Pleurodeles waltl]|uniref:Uncharacterized protein n=1 Tax=Pleurodeles waltl TaxID=8319 RepID=A0AAV7MX03_PLEWA|nr:hypothetical protein NDU88_005627 [Pleurodeles waltl]
MAFRIDAQLQVETRETLFAWKRIRTGMRRSDVGVARHPNCRDTTIWSVVNTFITVKTRPTQQAVLMLRWHQPSSSESFPVAMLKLSDNNRRRTYVTKHEHPNSWSETIQNTFVNPRK